MVEYLCNVGIQCDNFVEFGGGVGDVLVWCRDGAYVEFGFQ